MPLAQLAVTVGICGVLLTLAQSVTWLVGRKLGFAGADATAIMFCGSEKSLATGLPLSAILFHGPLAGMVILPVIIYHAMQLVVCASVARLLARRQSSKCAAAREPASV